MGFLWNGSSPYFSNPHAQNEDIRYRCFVPDRTTWWGIGPSCLAPDFPVDYSLGSDFGEAVAFP